MDLKEQAVRKVITLIISMLALSSFGVFAVGSNDYGHSGSSMMKSEDGSYNLFDGVSLTEQQRQQMRDLMRQARHELPLITVAEMDAMHKLVTADKFDEAGVRAQVEKMAQAEVERQVELAKVRNQMYHLLSPEQKAVLTQKYEQYKQRRISEDESR